MNLGALVTDQNSKPVQIGSDFITVSSTFESPESLTGSIQAIPVPTGAVEFIVNPITNNLKVSEDSTMSHYDVVVKDTKEAIPCARMTSIYIQGTAADVINFRFTRV